MSTKQTVSREEIQKIARLAKLHLDDEKRDVYTQQINAILEHVQKLETLDVADVEPLSHVLDLVNVTRKDESAGSLPRDKVLANAPLTEDGPPEKRATDGEFFLVPRVIKTDQ
ncbi:MAG: Asp-tRNA(Asn)/Glu-tRNA(Gln) amidotransferase subunit GatC [Calditrichaeota bacterium]|nr:Asp-tRNA(Asn)/Glu-tRNA(Gln) amidotransferase subunit GatC [Calditrichota bacterium]